MSLKILSEKIKKCKLCRLSATRKNAVPGEGNENAEILLVGQAPGREEDNSGRPFVGRAGMFLDYLLEKNNISRKDVFITSAVKCFPPKNRKPKQDEIEACKNYLNEQIKLIKPKTIVLMGGTAVKAVLKTDRKIDKLHGKTLTKGIKYLCTYHPSAGMRFPKIRKKIEEDFKKLKNGN